MFSDKMMGVILINYQCCIWTANVRVVDFSRISNIVMLANEYNNHDIEEVDNIRANSLLANIPQPDEEGSFWLRFKEVAFGEEDGYRTAEEEGVHLVAELGAYHMAQTIVGGCYVRIEDWRTMDIQ